MQNEINVVELWFHYEEVAMHFNDLLMQYRLQLLGGFGAVGTVASYLIGGRVDDQRRRNWLRFLVSAGMLVLLAAAASLDVWYYDRLLRGAVKALLELETQNPQIQLSTRIEETVGIGKYAARGVYMTLMVLVAGFTWWSWNEHRRGS